MSVQSPEVKTAEPFPYSRTTRAVGMICCVSMPFFLCEIMLICKTVSRLAGLVGISSFTVVYLLACGGLYLLHSKLKQPKLTYAIMYGALFLATLWVLLGDVFFPIYPEAPFYTFLKAGDYFVIICMILLIVLQFTPPVIFMLRSESERKAAEKAKGTPEEDPEGTPKHKRFKYTRFFNVSNA